MALKLYAKIGLLCVFEVVNSEKFMRPLDTSKTACWTAGFPKSWPAQQADHQRATSGPDNTDEDDLGLNRYNF
ncbi:MAG: hypothetical protein KF851_05155 [Pirellulaceae bacterium]|nr:hypothetical protein [Pirellulaceae bacterium]